MTVSPTLTSIGTRLPLSSTRPGPTAMTVPSCGFSLAVSGITSPDAVVVSASLAWTRIRSSSGLIATFVAVVTGIPSWGIWFAYLVPPGGPSSRVPAPPGEARRRCRRAGTLDLRVLTEGYAAASTPSRRVPAWRVTRANQPGDPAASPENHRLDRQGDS